MRSPLPVLLALTALLLVLPGCGTPKTSDFSADEVPENFAVSVYRHLEGGKHTYLTLSPTGELAFAGGRPAIMRQTTPVMTLTPQQRQEVWALILRNDLLGLKGQGFRSMEHAAYEVEIKTGKGFNKKDFRVVDEHVTQGVKDLHDKLFDLQADERYRPMQTQEVLKQDRQIQP